jgi:hypothetical protein
MAEDREQTTKSAEPADLAQDTFRRLAQNSGLLVALLYAAGALDLMGNLRGSGVDVTEVFPIIPIDEHLARSVGLLVSPRGLLLAFLLLATTFVLDALSQRRGAGDGEPRGIVAWLSRQPLPAIVLLVVAYVALLFFRPLMVVQQACSLFALYTVTRVRPGATMAVSTRMLAIVFALLLGFVVRSYALPEPLPRAEVMVEGPTPVRGLYVAVVGDNWYVAVRPGVIRVVGEQHLVTARLVSREHRRDWTEYTLPGLLGR